MTDELKAKQEVNEWYSTEQVQNMVDFLRRSANENGGLDVGDYWARNFLPIRFLCIFGAQLRPVF